MSVRRTHARRRALAAAAAALALAAGTLPATAAAATAAEPIGAWREQAQFGPDDPWGSNLVVARSGQALGAFRTAGDGCQGCVDNPTPNIQRRAHDNTWTRYTAATPHAVVRADLGYGGYAAWLTRGGQTRIMERRDIDNSFRRPPVTVSTSYAARLRGGVRARASHAQHHRGQVPPARRARGGLSAPRATVRRRRHLGGTAADRVTGRRQCVAEGHRAAERRAAGGLARAGRPDPRSALRPGQGRHLHRRRLVHPGHALVRARFPEHAHPDPRRRTRDLGGTRPTPRRCTRRSSTAPAGDRSRCSTPDPTPSASGTAPR